MGYKLTWSPSALGDLHEIVNFTALNSDTGKAKSFGFELIAALDLLPFFPQYGRVVPEFENPNLREVIFRRYRIVYRLNQKQKCCEVARIWHAARGIPKI